MQKPVLGFLKSARVICEKNLAGYDSRLGLPGPTASTIANGFLNPFRKQDKLILVTEKGSFFGELNHRLLRPIPTLTVLNTTRPL